MVPDFWAVFSPGELMVIALAWVVAFGMLAIAYAKTTRWDRAWKERWEQRHGTSLETLRQNKQRMLKVLTVGRWIMLALFFIGVGTSLGPIVDIIKGLRREPLLVFAAFGLNVLTLLLLALVAVGLEVVKYQLRRSSELLAAEPRR